MKKLILLTLILISSVNHLFAQWEVSYIDTTYSVGLFEVIRFHDDSLGLAMGKGSSILRTSDQGESWEKISIDYQVNFSDMQFISADTVIAVGYYNVDNTPPSFSKILRSFDGGVSWDSLSTLNEKEITSLHFLDTSTGLVAGYNGIYKTHDGGFSWDTVYSIYQEGYWIGSFDNINFINNQTGFASMYGTILEPDLVFDNLILKTTDSGQTWNTISSFEGRPYSVEFYNESVGYISQTNRLLKTENGGITWDTVFTDIDGYELVYSDIQFLNDSTIFFAGHRTVELTTGGNTQNFTFLKTTNGAQDWLLTDTFSLPLYSVHFVNDSTGFVTNAFNFSSINTAVILKTTSCGGPIIGLPDLGPPTSLQRLNNDIDLLVYPNPTNDLLHINLKDNKRKSATIYNALGQKLAHFVFNSNEHTFSLKNFPSGNYWLLVETEVGDVVRQFVKN